MLGMQRAEPKSSNQTKHRSRATKNRLITIQISGSGHVILERNPVFRGGQQDKRIYHSGKFQPLSIMQECPLKVQITFSH